MRSKSCCVWFGLVGMFAAPALAQRSDGAAAVIVNGAPIDRSRIVNLAMEARGLEAMQQLIMLELVRAESQKRGANVTQADVDREFRDALARIARESGAEMSEEHQQQALDTMLEEKGISRAEFMISMERNAHLRKMVNAALQIDEPTLREEFARTRGEKVRVRHIQIPANELRTLDEALEALKTEDFAAVARRLSRNAETREKGGELPPFTFDDAQLPAALREAAFALRPGQVSPPVRTENFFHILKLEERIPAAGVRFEDVRADVERSLRERVVPGEMNKLASELFRKADIRVIDGRLREKYAAFLSRTAN